MINNAQLRETFLSPNMKYYFDKKLPHLSSEEINVQIEELLKYLNMAVYCNGDIPFTKEIDEIWHFWVLETMEYQNLCSKLQGGGFFHHSSNDYEEFKQPDIKQRKPEFNRSVDILASYVLNYGDFEEDRVRFWPVAESLMEQFGGNVAEFNAWLRSCIKDGDIQHMADEDAAA